MKTRNLALLSVIIMVLLACNKDKSEYLKLIQPKLECMGMSRPAGSYNYPVYPGMPEWADFKTTQEMIDACQIPEKKLKNMSTQAVLQAIWEYPFFSYIIYNQRYLSSIETYSLSHNAYAELCTRKNAGNAILKRLKLFDASTCAFSDEPKAMEILISQEVFLSQLSVEEKKELIRTTLAKDKDRQNNTSNDFFRARIWLLIGRIMLNANYQPFVNDVSNNHALKLFFEYKDYEYMPYNYGDIPQIIQEHSNQFLNE